MENCHGFSPMLAIGILQLALLVLLAEGAPIPYDRNTADESSRFRSPLGLQAPPPALHHIVTQAGGSVVRPSAQTRSERTLQAPAPPPALCVMRPGRATHSAYRTRLLTSRTRYPPGLVNPL
ncbi:hypothetical protein AAFF_G00212880 [Aldrovandia affinis]|uniref:Uncharacterized protein n=1 Tax=Aldrovandia affinis TaxID=143900 RepID=A0AAD7W5X0_9TELE|nr:hypothetical protein AAFF_G00212880 [Aldrovandia affinis]